MFKTAVGLLVLSAAVAASVPARAAEETATPPAPGSFGSYDRDGDNRLTEEEMRNGMASIYADIDQNSDGVLDADELPPLRDAAGEPVVQGEATRIEDIMAQATTIFAKLDRDGDGFLTAEEFAMAIDFGLAGE